MTFIAAVFGVSVLWLIYQLALEQDALSVRLRRLEERVGGTNCPACGYPGKAEGGPFKGIYTPGKACGVCGFLEEKR